ncbi:MAG: hypothetical protein P4L92_01450 [Rudaea sp.]|nr:hypothetical protein [Rudaea sp.]
MPIDLKPSGRNRGHCVLAALGVLASGVVAAMNGAQGLRFDSQGVLDLAERTQKASGDQVPFAALDVTEAGQIVAAPTLSEDQATLAFSDDVYACKTPSKACSQEHERKLIDAAAGAVRRNGRQLGVVAASGTPAEFVDWNLPESKTADGDAETHWYLGRLDGSGYYRVEVQFGHDAPGNFLINPASGKTAFVHNGSDVVALSPDGMQLVTFNTLNSPLSLRVASLDRSGPRLALQCETSNENNHVEAAFKGWHDPHSFDLVFEIHPERNKLARRIALRLTQGSSGWTLAASDQVPLIAMGFVCRAAAAEKSAPDKP